MGNETRYVCLVETRRLLLVIGVLFGLILFVQYFELPYNNILSSLFAGKSQLAPLDNFPSKESYSSHSDSRNLTNFSSLNSTDSNAPNGVSSDTKVYDQKDTYTTNVKDDSDPDSSKSFNDTSNDDLDPEDESPSKDFIEIDHNSTVESVVTSNSPASPTSREPDIDLPVSNDTSKSNASLAHDGVGEIVRTFEVNGDKILNQETSPSTSVGQDAETVLEGNENPKIAEGGLPPPVSDPPISSIPASRGRKRPSPAVVPISEMNDMLLHSYESQKRMSPRWSSPVDQELLNVKTLIENAPIVRKDPQFDVSLYRNFSAFKRSYELMEQTLKVYIYAEGKRPVFHQPPLKGIYASEGWFMKLIQANKNFVTKNPNNAHLFYLPFSSRELEVNLYKPNSHSRQNLIECLSDYVETITTKYSFWNRTDGADHFLVACHDWAPAETREIMANCIRALCNADVKEGFQFGKDASLPETYIRSPQNPLRQLGGKPPSQRKILAFFAGSMHGYLRPILLNQWQNKDPDIKVFGKIRKRKGETTYAQYMKSSKYCICAKGYEVNSPRVVEAIFFECVPVIISDNFVPPFFETLNWESFAVFVLEKDIPNLKNILLSISKKRYIKMQQRVKQVQQHFLWHSRPVKYDVFHMILHSVWYNRVLQAKIMAVD